MASKPILRLTSSQSQLQQRVRSAKSLETFEVYMYIVVSINTDKGIYSTMVRYVCIHVWNEWIVCTL